MSSGLIALQLDLGTYMIGASIVSLVVGMFAAWCLWRVRSLLGVVAQLTERVSILSNSISLLTDTTEGCFKAVAVQLQTLQPPVPLKSRSTAASPKRPSATHRFAKSLNARSVSQTREHAADRPAPPAKDAPDRPAPSAKNSVNSPIVPRDARLSGARKGMTRTGA